MLFAYRANSGRLERLAMSEPVEGAVWIDLYRPQPAQIEAVGALGVEVPSLADMEEIEISARLYRDEGSDHMTVVLPGMNDDKERVTGPVTFILTPDRLVTVRHHAPRPFETYPEQAQRVGPGCGDPDRILLSLLEAIIGRLADILEGANRAMDDVARLIYGEHRGPVETAMRDLLRRIGSEGEQISQVRLSLMTVERMISFYGYTSDERPQAKALRPFVKALMRDIQALEVHADFLSSRVALSSDATLGMINLAQAQTIKIFSVLAVVFLPPTVIASAYGMNFEYMPELAWRWGYPLALVLMLASAVGTYLFFKWKKLL
jgi:magnesium transporter